MAIYTITAHIEFPSPSGAVQTTPIRMAIPATSELEAKAKAERFIELKLKVVVDKCDKNKPLETFDDVMKQFGKIFGNG